MKVSPLLVTAHQPAWLRLVLTVAFALASAACTSRQYHFITVFAWFLGYFLLVGIPWLIVRNLPAEHPVRVSQAEHQQLARRFCSYRRRDELWLGIGLLVSLIFAHGLPDSRHFGPYFLVTAWLVIGTVSRLVWRSKRHEWPSTGIA